MPVKVQRYIAILSVILFAAKMLAWWLTHSVTILTDALESIVNMVAGFLGLYSVILSARPRDTNHPYGHGKVEFISAGVEGTLIVIAGCVIILEAASHLMHPATLSHLNTGLIIVSAAGLVNYLAGSWAMRQGKAHHSLVLESAGAHLVTDAYSTLAVIIGVSVLMLTGNKWPWLDSVVALFFAAITIRTGYLVLRRSVSGMMDEMDLNTLKAIIDLLQKNRPPQWVDLHNLRVIRYGSLMHIDAHLTLPYYQQVADADREIHAMEDLIKTQFGDAVELFIHIDGCMPYQCHLCAMPDCKKRKSPLQSQIQWNTTNVWEDVKHGRIAAGE